MSASSFGMVEGNLPAGRRPTRTLRSGADQMALVIDQALVAERVLLVVGQVAPAMLVDPAAAVDDEVAGGRIDADPPGAAGTGTGTGTGPTDQDDERLRGRV